MPKTLLGGSWPRRCGSLDAVSQVPTYEVAPTVGLSVEEFETEAIKFQAFDMSGEVRPGLMPSLRS